MIGRLILMENHRLFLLLLFLSAAAFFSDVASGKTPNHHEKRYASVLIDCGASQSTTFNASLDGFITSQWLADDDGNDFTKAGETFFFTSPNLSYPMNTLRFFPSGRRNCYNLPLWYSAQKYLIRAGFYYGNYDGLSRPPQFSLRIDGHQWATVETSLSQEAVYYELIYKTKKEGVRVCLERATSRDDQLDDDVPFISSLEGVYMYNEMYRMMENDTALLLHSRTNYGANKTIQTLFGIFEECCGRVWKYEDEIAEYENKQGFAIPDGRSFSENFTPWPVMATEIQARNNNASIRLPVNFSQNLPTTTYFVLYFKDVTFRVNNENQTNISIVDIYIGDTKFYETLNIPDWLVRSTGDDVRVVTLYPIQVNGSTTVTISPANGTRHPPLLNAMEVFSVLNVSHAGELLVVASRHIWFYLLFTTLILINLMNG